MGTKCSIEGCAREAIIKRLVSSIRLGDDRILRKVSFKKPLNLCLEHASELILETVSRS